MGARGPAPAIPPGIAAQNGAVGDLALTRLLSVAWLTPAQAVALGADLIAGLENRDITAGLRPEAVRVGRDGRACVNAGSSPSMNGAGLASAAALLDRLRAAARSSTADPGLIPALERAATEARSPDGRVAFVAAILREADAAGGARARVELSRLVAMVAGDVAPSPGAGPAPAASARRRRPPRRGPRAVARTVVARSWKWALSIVVLVATVVLEIAFLRDDISRDVTAVLEAGRSAVTATTAPALPPLVSPAPTAAGTISGVGLRPIQPCAPGAGCVLRVQVLVQPQAEPQTIAWDLHILDRCTGESVTAPGGTVTVPPHGDRADVVSTVGLPAADALAVMAITNLPYPTASAAVHVPESGTCAT